MQLTGIHHLTAISAEIRDNHRFYTQTLGMRLVKRSVNQDDVSAYHLFYADAVGTPGTDLTFFDWPVPRERRGTRSIVRTHLRVRGVETLAWWAQRLDERRVQHGEIIERDGRPRAATSRIPKGSGWRSWTTVAPATRRPWERSPVPAEHQVRGLGPIVHQRARPRTRPTGSCTRVFNMRPVREYPHPDNPGTRVHVYRDGRRRRRTPSCTWPCSRTCRRRARAPAASITSPSARPTPTTMPGPSACAHSTCPNSGKVDRYWFRSLYVREPNGVLFEIATDGPGFAVDEDPATLGEHVVLPPFLESHRAEILAGLKPID